MRSLGTALAIVALFAVVIGHTGAKDSLAHAVLQETIPAADETLTVPPAEVALRFNESVQLATDGLRVIDDTGSRVDLDDGGRGATGEWVRVSLQDDLADGTYLVSWAVISGDGHTIRGSFVFHIGEPSEEPPVAAEVSTPTWVSLFAGVTRWLGYTAALLAAGVAFFLAFVHDGRALEGRRLLGLVTVSAIAGLAAAPLSVLAESLVMSQGVPGQSLGRDHVELVLETGHGTAAGLLALGCILLLGAGRLGALWMLPGAAVVVMAFAWRGHSAAVDPASLGVAASIVHTAAAAVWFGGLVALSFVAWNRRGDGGDRVVPLLARFARLALIVFVVVAVAGAVLAFQVLPSVAALFDTRYGNLLVAKLVLLAAALVMAAFHRWRAIPFARRNGSASSTRFHPTLAAESLALVGVIALTAALVAVSPAPDEPEATESAGGLFAIDGFAGDFHFEVQVTPARTGENSIAVFFHAIDDADPATIQGVRAELTEQSRDIGPFTVELAEQQPGLYRHVGAEMNLPGDWQVTLAIRLSDFEEQRVSFEVPID